MWVRVAGITVSFLECSIYFEIDKDYPVWTSPDQACPVPDRVRPDWWNHCQEVQQSWNHGSDCEPSNNLDGVQLTLKVRTTLECMLKFYYRSRSRNQAVPTSESGVDLTAPLDSVLAEES
jgi:hypothetical protein